MFCPNCGDQNNAEQNYCRFCGLKLDSIARTVAEQLPSTEYAALRKRKRLFEKLGVLTISVSGLIGLCIIFAKAFYYKLILFGPDLLFGSAFAALVAFALLSLFFFNYPRLFMNLEQLRSYRLPEQEANSRNTNKLIEAPPFAPASVTENSTELLSVPRKK